MKESVMLDLRFLKREMHRLGLSETRLAIKAGLGQSTISRIFQKAGICAMETGVKVAEAFHVPLESIIAEPLSDLAQIEYQIMCGAEAKACASNKARRRLMAQQKRCGLCRFIACNENAREKDYTSIQGCNYEIKRCRLSDWLVTDVNMACEGFEKC